MQHPYYPQQPQQQQQPGGFYFYQPQHDSSQTLPYDHTTTAPTAAIPKNTTTTTNTNSNNNNTHFYNSAEDYSHHNNNNSTYEQTVPQTHLMTVGVATPPAPHEHNNNNYYYNSNSNNNNYTSVSPKQFGVDSNSHSRQSSPLQKQQQQQQQQQQSSFRPLFQPPQSLQFQQQSSQLQQSQLQQRAPSPPVFRDHVPTVPQPQFHSPVYQQENPLNNNNNQQQGSSHVSSSFLLPPLLRGGVVSYILNILLPQDEMDINTCVGNGNGGNAASVESVPLHRIRFGYPEDDIPLLQELGIFPQHIRSKALAVLNPFKSMSQEVVEDTDLAGPIVFAITLAFLLSLRGKLQFSTIYSHSVLGIIFTKLLLTLMTDHGVSLQFVISALGYCLIPSVVLAAFQSLLYLLFGYVGKTLLLPALFIVLWSAWCATSMLVNGLSMEQQRYLIMYPIFLFYAVFAALTIF